LKWYLVFNRHEQHVYTWNNNNNEVDRRIIKLPVDFRGLRRKEHGTPSLLQENMRMLNRVRTDVGHEW
jgi:hypothetical protein